MEYKKYGGGKSYRSDKSYDRSYSKSKNKTTDKDFSKDKNESTYDLEKTKNRLYFEHYFDFDMDSVTKDYMFLEDRYEALPNRFKELKMKYPVNESDIDSPYKLTSRINEKFNKKHNSKIEMDWLEIQEVSATKSFFKSISTLSFNKKIMVTYRIKVPDSNGYIFDNFRNSDDRIANYGKNLQFLFRSKIGFPISSIEIRKGSLVAVIKIIIDIIALAAAGITLLEFHKRCFGGSNANDNN